MTCPGLSCFVGRSLAPPRPCVFLLFLLAFLDCCTIAFCPPPLPPALCCWSTQWPLALAGSAAPPASALFAPAVWRVKVLPRQHAFCVSLILPILTVKCWIASGIWVTSSSFSFSFVFFINFDLGEVHAIWVSESTSSYITKTSSDIT